MVPALEIFSPLTPSADAQVRHLADGKDHRVGGKGAFRAGDRGDLRNAVLEHQGGDGQTLDAVHPAAWRP